MATIALAMLRHAFDALEPRAKSYVHTTALHSSNELARLHSSTSKGEGNEGKLKILMSVVRATSKLHKNPSISLMSTTCPV